MEISRYQKRFGVGPIGLLAGLAILGALWLLDRSLGHVEILSRPAPLRMIGCGFIAIWFCWQIECMRTMRQWWVYGRLCTTGPFRFVRHPIYAGGILLAAPGVALMFNSWIVLLLPALMYIANSFLIRREETMMAAVFGEEYLRYAARTGRFFPRILS